MNIHLLLKPGPSVDQCRFKKKFLDKLGLSFSEYGTRGSDARSSKLGLICQVKDINGSLECTHSQANVEIDCVLRNRS